MVRVMKTCMGESSMGTCEKGVVKSVKRDTLKWHSHNERMRSERACEK